MTNKELAKFRSKYLREGFREAVRDMRQINEANDMATADQVDRFVDAVTIWSYRLNEICQVQWISVAYSPAVKELREIYQSSIVQSSSAMNKLVNIRKKIKAGQPLSDRNLKTAKDAIDQIAPALEKSFVLAEKAYKIIYDASIKSLKDSTRALKEFI